MDLNNTISQQQTNSLTPKMVEELKILQMSNYELEEYIDNQLLENPLLDNENDEDQSLPFETDSYINHDRKKDFTEYTSLPISLRQYLKTQVREMSVSEKLKQIVFYLIENLNEDGYLATSVEEASSDLSIPAERVNQALKLIQRLEPAGVGARTLKECILLQLRRKNKVDQNIINIIKNHLMPLAHRKYSEICAKTGLAKKEVIVIHRLIKNTDPKPGQRFSNEIKPEYIEPELILQQVNQHFIVLFNYEWNIDLKLNSVYKQMTATDSKELNKYLKAKIHKANEIIRAVNQRKKTIIDVATYIMNYQSEFFKEGYKKLKPLTLKMVAENVGLHESTISRTVNGKYIQTPKGIFELKYFFSSQFTSSDSSHSSTYIKKKIETIINEEDKSKPLSDEQIKKLFEMAGIKVARRTISKYREELQILPSNMRKS